MLSAAITVDALAAEPIGLEDAKRFLRLDGDSLNGDVEMLIGAARGDIEDMTGLRLVEQTVEVRADAFSDFAHLEVGPVVRVVEIRYVDAQGVPQVLEPARYELTGAGLDRAIFAAIGASLPQMRTGRGAIVAKLLVGYGGEGDALPQNLRWAMLAAIRGKFEDRPVDLAPLLVNARIGG